ncbi:MAG: hypothetical protein QOJ02_2781 [Acidobacteriota bacterium]|jgi:hypothetical protein|nr:hypothetical protein [Acidobacteriota bacterium]
MISKILEKIVDQSTTFFMDKMLSRLVTKVQKTRGGRWILEKLRYHHTLRSGCSSYLAELEAKIKEMPFIYTEELEADIEKDFVEVKIEPIDLESLKIISTHAPRIPLDERLRRTVKIIFLGHGGVGKTTFQRHSILDLIYKKATFIYEKERGNLVPFYVPLKAVDNTDRSPILRYLLEKNRMLSFESGIELLTTLAKEKKLFLFLDGYDEIQLTGSKSMGNYVQAELDLIMSSKQNLQDSLFRNADLKYKGVYQALERCRIWLSCRQEFFEQHPVKINSSDMHEKSNLYPVELRGIINRHRLAKNIFQKYPKYSDLLNDESFIREVDRSEEELKSLSYNPLFLTVMCYIYVQKVKEHKNSRVNWVSSFNELILECLRLLLHDLDEDKARKDLSGEEKKAFLARRCEYINEKEEFLPYFASQLFQDDKNLFDIPYVKDKVRQFLTTECESPEEDTILTELKDDSTNHPHFAQQLASAGIFVIVDKHADEVLYDFPHRRFREVLAAKYFDEHDFNYLINNLKKEGLSELLYVFFNLTESKDKIIDALLNKIRDGSDVDHYDSLLVNCLRNKRASYNPYKVFYNYFLECLDSDIHPFLSSDTLDYFRAKDDGFCELLSCRFEKAVENGSIFSCSLCFQLLLRENKALLKKLCETYLASRFANKDFLTLVMLVKYPILGSWFNDMGTLDDYQKLFLYLNGIFDSVFMTNRGALQIDRNDLEYCYILTDPVINKTENLIKDRDSLLRLKDMKYKIHTSNIFLYQPPLKIDEPIKNTIFENSSIKYEHYKEIINVINSIKHHAPTDKLFRY